MAKFFSSLTENLVLTTVPVVSPPCWFPLRDDFRTMRWEVLYQNPEVTLHQARGLFRAIYVPRPDSY